MNYNIICGNKSDLEKADKGYISSIPWGATYTPTAYFQGVFEKDKGFHFRLTCLEKDPVGRLTGCCHGVSADSCMEIFLNFSPEKSDTYINFEMNSLGAHLFGLGKDRYGRVDMAEDVMPEVSAKILDDRWVVDLFVPIASLKGIYGDLTFDVGSVLKGNAYKCGGPDAPCTHYLSWSPMQTNERDFHRPDRFGTFTIV